MMGKGNIVKIGNIAYETEVLTGATERGATGFAYGMLNKYRKSNGWVFSRETGEYEPLPTEKEERSRDIFEGLSWKIWAIFASDKNGVFDSTKTLLDLALSNWDGFLEIYRAAITANPTLDKEQKESEGADPNS